MAHVYIGVGSNLGQRQEQLEEGLKRLSEVTGIEVLRTSSVYETKPVGGPPQGDYLNAVWEVETSLSPKALLKELLLVEAQMGRIRGEANASRTLDLDILIYDDLMIREPGLEVPHPRLHERLFVLKPFCEIAPETIHPEKKETMQTLLEKNNAYSS